MAVLSEAYLENHRRQLQMLAGGVLVCLLLVFFQSNERALFALNPASEPAALAAIVDNGQLVGGTPQQRTIAPAAFFVRQPNAIVSPGPAPGALTAPPVPPVVLALAEPNGLTPFSELPPGTANGLSVPGTQPGGFQGGPLAGSAPTGASAVAPLDVVAPLPSPSPTDEVVPPDPAPTVTPLPSPSPTDVVTQPEPVPAVPEPKTWIMMIVGFFVVGSSLRMRRVQSIQLEPVARKAD